MRTLILSLLLGVTGVAMVASTVPAAGPMESSAASAGAAAEILPYRFEDVSGEHTDRVTLVDGSLRLGKVMEWADKVLVFQGGAQPDVFAVADVDRFEFARGEAKAEVPAMADLTVAYVERLPRDPGLHGHVAVRGGVLASDVASDSVAWHPTAGANVTFRVHVLNAGGAASAQVACRVSVDGRVVKEGNIPDLKAGQEHVLDVAWPWADGEHTLQVEVDPNGKTPEIARWNNTFVERIDALGVTIVVAKTRYAAFRKVRNVVDTFSFEDWVQYQMRNLNAILALSVYPSSPEGVTERVRCDRIVVVDDPASGSHLTGLREGGKASGLAEYAAVLTFDRPADGELIRYTAIKVDWQQLQALGSQLGLASLTATDTTLEQCMVLDQHERYVQRRHLFPWPAHLMHTAGGFPLTEPQAAYLNRVKGQPRGAVGEYLYQLPETITLDVRSNQGMPLPGVQIDVYQLMSEGEDAGYIVGYGRQDPMYSIRTDENGRAALINQEVQGGTSPAGYALKPNPFGQVDPTGANGLLMLRVRNEQAEEYHFLRLYDCNVAFLRGQAKEYLRRVETRLGAADAPPAPPFVACRMEDRSGNHPPMFIRWRFPKDFPFADTREFRVYKRTSFGGQETKPWRLVEVIPEIKGDWTLRHDGTYYDEFRYDGPYSLDTWFAVTVVDRQGRESNLSAPCFIAHGQDCVALALDGNSAYMTMKGAGPLQMLRWDGAVGTQPYGVRTKRFEGYKPAFSGIAVASDGRLVVTDPVNHVLAFYDRGDLTAVVPQVSQWPGVPGSAPGEFFAPADVAVDEQGRMYVADRGNNRVQILDAHGGFVGLLDPDFRFKGPHSLGMANGHLCVTDLDGSRCRVYSVEGEPPSFVRQLPTLIDANRCLVSSTGQVYVAGQDPAGGAGGIAVYTPEGEGAKYEKDIFEGMMGKYHHPRGLWFLRTTKGEVGYFANEFLFDVRRVDME